LQCMDIEEISITKKPFADSMEKKIDFLGIGINELNVEEFLRCILQYAVFEKRKFVTYLNAHCFNLAIKDKKYRQILSVSDIVYPDGISIVWAARILGYSLPERVNAADFFGRFCRETQDRKISLYLLGGSENTIKKAIERLKANYPRLKVHGSYNGYFSENEEIKIIEEINRQRPHILLLGLGAGRQEKWVFRNLNKLDVNVVWAVGGLFNLLSGELKRAPRWMIKAGLEWLYRLIQQPNKLWRRYLIGNTIFIFLVFREFLRNLYQAKIYYVIKKFMDICKRYPAL